MLNLPNALTIIRILTIPGFLMLLTGGYPLAALGLFVARSQSMTDDNPNPVKATARELSEASDRKQPIYEYQYEPGSGATRSSDASSLEEAPKPNNLAQSLKL